MIVFSINLLLQTSFIVFTTAKPKNITSPAVTNWGQWGIRQRCPSGTYAQGFQVKTEPYLYIDGDDTGLNSIRLFCGNPCTNETKIITSTEGSNGLWGTIHSCFPGFLNGFQLKVLPNAKNCGDGDNFAATNIRFFCTNGELEGDGLSFGIWGKAQYCDTNQRICGIQTQVEAVKGKGDDTALNNILLECCDIISKVYSKGFSMG